jgi:hypothetical protein
VGWQIAEPEREQKVGISGASVEGDDREIDLRVG